MNVMNQTDDMIQMNIVTIDRWKQMAQENPEATISVNTNGISMWPLLHCYGDSVRIVYPHRELQVGDFVMFQRDSGRVFAHRIIWMDDTMVETLGDNCSKSDGKFPRHQVFGLVTHACRKGHLINVETPFWRFYGKFMIWSNPVRMFIRDKLYRPCKRFAKKVIKGK